MMTMRQNTAAVMLCGGVGLLAVGAAIGFIFSVCFMLLGEPMALALDGMLIAAAKLVGFGFILIVVSNLVAAV